MEVFLMNLCREGGLDGTVAIRGGGRTEIVGDRQERLEGAWSKVLQVAYRRQQIREFRSKRAWLGGGIKQSAAKERGVQGHPLPLLSWFPGRTLVN